MKCTRCGAELALEDKFCGECGAPRPQLSPRFAEAERRFVALRARYRAGELDDATYEAELWKLVIEDEGGGYWMLGADSGEWYWYDGAQWVRKDPPLAARRRGHPRAGPTRPPTVAQPPPAKRGFPWTWVGVGCVGLLIIAAGVLVFPLLMRFISTLPGRAVVTPVASTIVPIATLSPQVVSAVPTIRPTNTSSPPTKTPTPTPTLAFSLRPYDPERDTEAQSIISRIPSWEGAKQPGNYRWEVDFPAGIPALVLMGWCAADEQTLEANLANMEYELVIDGSRIDLTQLAEKDVTDEERVCRVYVGVITGWSPGRHSYMWIRHIYETVNDGWNTFQAGDYVLEFVVNVVEGLVFEEDFNDTSGGWPEGDHDSYRFWIEGGGYHLLVKKVQWAVWSSYEEKRYGDFIFTAAARQVSNLPGEYGLVFRYQDNDNFYFLNISADGYYILGKQLDGKWVILVDWTPSPAINQGQGENVLGVLCAGDEISAYVNGQSLVTISDDSFAEGYVGLMALTFGEPNVHVAFDWVRVEATK